MVLISGADAMGRAITISWVQDLQSLGGLGKHFQTVFPSALHLPVCSRQERKLWPQHPRALVRADSEALRKSYKKNLIYEGSAEGLP